MFGLRVKVFSLINLNPRQIAMNIKQALVLSTVSLAAASVFATPVDGPTRAQVEQSVVAARQSGELAPAGEHDGPPGGVQSLHSDVSRGEMKQQVVVARNNGQLRPAGEAGDGETVIYPAPAGDGPSATRAEVKAEVLAARRDGELVPAGEGFDAEQPQMRPANTPKFLVKARNGIAHLFASR